MLRLLLALAAVVAALSFDARPARAGGEFPWCAVLNVGTDSVHWECQYRTVWECIPNVLAGNRGTCNPNPAWVAYTPEARPYRPKRHRRAR